MLWIKRNLGLLLGIVGALALSGLAAWYLIAQIAANNNFAKELEEQKAEMTRLGGLTYFPNDKNIATTKSEMVRLSSLLTRVQQLYQSEPPPKLDDQQFASQMLTTIAELQTQAQTNGVILPAKYGFTFDSLREHVKFDQAGIPLLTTQLREVKELCEVLFSNRIHSLVSIQRVRVATNDPPSGAHYLTKTMASNNWLTITPYEVTFRGFATEVAGVLDGLQRTKTYFVVRTVDVIPLEVTRQETPPPPPPPTKGPAPKTGAAATPAQPKAELIRVLDERPLQCRLRLEVVKLNQPPAK
ncbi:MAG: hypothetical protein AB1705_15220 [Verrucomicrobiota bacterium]